MCCTDLLVALLLFVLSGCSQAQTPPPIPLQGFIGVVQPDNGITWTNQSVYSTFRFGITEIYTEAFYGNWLFADNVNFHCHTADVNLVIGMLAPPTQGGLVNNPNDTNVWVPAAHPGLIQSAHRYSEISKSCPQIWGVLIDDFLENLILRKTLTLQDVRDVRGALVGKPVSVDSRTGRWVVDHQGIASTPWLKLFVTVYDHEIEEFDPKTLGLLELLDGIGFWIFDQDQRYQEFVPDLEKLMAKLPGKIVTTGAYIRNHKGFKSPAGVASILKQSVELYDTDNSYGMAGFFLFSGIFLSKESLTKQQWESYALPQLFREQFYPWLGGASFLVTDAASSKPLAAVDAQAFVGSHRILVAHKRTDAKGEMQFGAWAGRGQASVIVRFSKEGYVPCNVTVLVYPQIDTHMPVKMQVQKN